MKPGTRVDFRMRVDDRAEFSGTYLGEADDGRVKIQAGGNVHYLPKSCIIGESPDDSRLTIFQQIANRLRVVI